MGVPVSYIIIYWLYSLLILNNIYNKQQAFYRWLSEKYPKIVNDVLEQRAANVEGQEIPIDLTQPNPNGIEVVTSFLSNWLY